MRTSNPALPSTIFSNQGYVSRTDAMTISGTVNKTALLLLCTLLTAGWTWMKFYKSGGDVNAVNGWMSLGVVAGLVLAIVTVFKTEWASYTAVPYALCEGLFIGGISAIMEASFHGIVLQAATLTLGTLATMLGAYQSGLIRATEKFKLGVVAATGGIAIFYLLSLVLSFFHINIPLIYSNNLVGIGFSLFVIVIAALNFVIDFDFIEQGARRGAPKYMEWYGAFALMVTMIWLYIEFLRLISKLRSR